MITTSFVELAHGLLVDVQRNVRAPAVVSPVIVVVGEEGVVIEALVPETWLHEPDPETMVLAAMDTVPTFVHTD